MEPISGEQASALSQQDVDAAFASASQELARRIAASTAASQQPEPAEDDSALIDDVFDLDAALNALDVSATAEAATAAPAPEAKPASALTPEQQEKIIQQVEFYFSDVNLPTDEFLLSRVKQNKQGWVHLGVIAKFNKMKKLCKGNWALLGEALKSSTQLEVNARCSHVRRVSALPEVDLFEVASRTCVVENLPDKSTAESVQNVFQAAGPVRMVRICPPTAAGGSAKSTLQAAEDTGGALAFVCTQTHALVEFASTAAALNAVRTLNDAQNWRTGLRVRQMYRGNVHRTQQVTEGCEEEDPEAGTTTDGEGAGDARGGQKPQGGAKKGAKGREPKKNYAQWAAAGSYKQHKEKEDAAARERGNADGGEGGATSTSDRAAATPPPIGGEEGNAPGAEQRPRRFFRGTTADNGAGASGAAGGGGGGGGAAGGGGGGGGTGVREARMPDGTKGFSLGRGKGLAPPIGSARGAPVPASGGILPLGSAAE